jgi:hypothetical protein
MKGDLGYLVLFPDKTGGLEIRASPYILNDKDSRSSTIFRKWFLIGLFLKM